MLRYACAIGSVALALALTRGFGHENIGITPLFFAAVMVSAWYGGLGPGLLATALAGVASSVFFVGPDTQRFGLDDAVREIVFVAVAVLISSLHSSTKRSEQRLRQATADAEAANQAKDRFLAVLSHELRNPLNPVLSAASLHERDTTLSPSLREDLTMIRRNAELEARLIDDLLDLNRISHGKMSMQFEPADVHELIDDAVSICRNEIDAKGIRLVVHKAASRSCVSADAVRMRQVIWNLLRNALKFTPSQGRITLATGDAPDERLQISVTDTGIGIEPDVLTRIFDPFDQGTEHITRQFGGLGLGLAISRTLVQAHGGTITAASEGAGRGATFSVMLPLTTELPVDHAAPSEVRSSLPRSPLRILLVEDHEDTCRIMSKLLRASRHDVSTAASVDAALQAARDSRFDLVIADLGLPDGSGLDLMRQLKQQYNVPGIALTGYGTNDDMVRTRQAGFDDHLTKPVDLMRLEAAIQRVASTPPDVRILPRTC